MSSVPHSCPSVVSGSRIYLSLPFRAKNEKSLVGVQWHVRDPGCVVSVDPQLSFSGCLLALEDLKTVE